MTKSAVGTSDFIYFQQAYTNRHIIYNNKKKLAILMFALVWQKKTEEEEKSRKKKEILKKIKQTIFLLLTRYLPKSRFVFFSSSF